jgi:hypothetical protein
MTSDEPKNLFFLVKRKTSQVSSITRVVIGSATRETTWVN